MFDVDLGVILTYTLCDFLKMQTLCSIFEYYYFVSIVIYNRHIFTYKSYIILLESHSDVRVACDCQNTSSHSNHR